MATLINNAGVQHYANKMVLAENRKVGSKSLPTALNDIDNLIDEMKTSFDAEYGSALDMKLENNENVFSVGTGTNVDKRSEVENSFTDIELNGNSMVNLCPSFTNNSTNLNSFNVPLTNKHYVEYWIKNSDTVLGNRSAGLLKKGVTYTTICDAYLEETLDTTVEPNTNPVRNCSLMFYQYNENAGANKEDFVYSFNVTPPMKKGERVTKFMTTFTPTKDFDRVTLRLFTANLAHATTFKGQLNNLIILEGDWTNKPIPQYFEGLKSVGQDDVNGHKIEILSQNKNLIEKNKVVLGGINDNGTINNDNAYWRLDCFLQIKPNTNYVLSINGILQSRLFYYDKDFNFISSALSTNKKPSPSNARYLKFRFHNVNGINLSNANIQLEEGLEYTTFIEGKMNKKEISLSEPLRGLPNGVRDTIEKINGEWKIVRRCAEIILNGSEYWDAYDFGIKDTTRAFSFIDSTNPRSKQVWSNNQFNSIITNNLKVVGSILYLNDCVGVAQGYSDTASSNQWLISIPISSMNTNDSIGFKDWLSANNVKIIYELITPIIEDISPVTLQCWKNGTISIDEVLPVETTHTVALNKPAQIKRNIEELTALRKRVQALEEQYDQIALEQAHQLSLINHSIELDYDI